MERDKRDTDSRQVNSATNDNTMVNYMQLATHASRRKDIKDEQRKQIEGSYKSKLKKRKGKEVDKDQLEKALTEIIAEMKKMPNRSIV